MVRDYRNGDSSYVPFIGECTISYEGEEETDKGIKAKLSLEFDLSEKFVRSVGQIIDGEEKSDIENEMLGRISASLQDKF